MRRDPRRIERRAANRSAADGDVTVGWWDGPDYRTASGVLRDISLRGARVVMRLAPPTGATAWLYLHDADQAAWLECRAVQVQRFRLRSRMVHLQFTEICPYGFFRAAVQGCHLEGGGPPLIDAEFDDRLWR